MAVQEAVRTVTIPRQAGPAEPPPSVPEIEPQQPQPVGKDRPLTAEERQFVVALGVMLVLISTIIVTGLFMAERVWS